MHQSRAYDTDGVSQVGYGINGPYLHATLWKGSADSVVDLNPNGFDRSIAMGVDGQFQVGSGRLISNPHETHALMWTGSSSNFVDLNPAGFLFSAAEAVYGNMQVGFGNELPGGRFTDRALLWYGTAESVVDLHQYVSVLGDFVGSRAFSITPNGSIIGHVTAANGGNVAVIWTPVPEPDSIYLLATIVFGFSYFVRRRD
jgi:hypothetical protein